MKQLEEFMVFEDEDGKTGIIVKHDSDNCPWWKCYKQGTGGQVFNENDGYFNKIIKLYKVNEDHYECYAALKYMLNGDLKKYDCVYDKSTEKEIEPLNIIINATVNPDSITDIEKIIDELQEKIKNLKINLTVQ